MRISSSSSRSPAISALSTEGIPSMASWRSRANLSRVRSGTSPDSVTRITGNRLKLISCTDRLVGVVGQLGLGRVDLLADIGDGRVGVEAGLELQGDAGVALAALGAHLLDPLDGAQLLLHGAHQQALGILGRDAVVGHHHVDDGDVDVRVGLLGDFHVGDGAGDQDQHQRQQNCAGVAESGVDDPLHGPVFFVSGTGATL